MYPTFDESLDAFIEGIESKKSLDGSEKRVVADAFDDFVVIGVIRQKEKHVMDKLSIRWLQFMFDYGIMEGTIYEVDKDFVLIVAEKLTMPGTTDVVPELFEVIKRAPRESKPEDVRKTADRFFELNPELKALTDSFAEVCPFDVSRIDIKWDNFGINKAGNLVFFDLFI